MYALEKAAEFGARMGEKVARASYGIPAVAMQHHLPIHAKRKDLTEKELARIAEAEDKWFPRMFESYGTPAHELMSSPGKGALLHGIGLGGLGALMGGKMFGGTGALVGGGAGALLGAASGYSSREAKNEGIKDMMARLGPDSTKRDLLSDPVYNQDAAMDRMERMQGGQNAMLAAALYSR